MPVEYDPKTGLINLHNDQISYVIQILAHRYHSEDAPLNVYNKEL